MKIKTIIIGEDKYEVSESITGERKVARFVRNSALTGGAYDWELLARDVQNHIEEALLKRE